MYSSRISSSAIIAQSPPAENTEASNRIVNSLHVTEEVQALII